MMNDDQAIRWRKTRKLGKEKYMLAYGVLPWGIGITALFTGFEWFTQATITYSWIYIRLAVFTIVGFFISTVRWHMLEQKYDHYISNNDAAE